MVTAEVELTWTHRNAVAMTPTDKLSDVARHLYKLADKEGLHPRTLKKWIPALGDGSLPSRYLSAWSG